ncbi:hypothetical protein Slin15195_G129040 [Septoria linicola]|uniref:Uncharacterized protein n=1 Tax=Septoria linicola TaxID=215465 RepID=A0A9Q9B2S5_9PEZI|nr:hypothetical protein Slin14017_G121570 [Septoria linicola]USW59585.1 hypothetical protein Slin15195_G129040 [Septoria linicola]
MPGEEQHRMSETLTVSTLGCSGLAKHNPKWSGSKKRSQPWTSTFANVARSKAELVSGPVERALARSVAADQVEINALRTQLAGIEQDEQSTEFDSLPVRKTLDELTILIDHLTMRKFDL